MEIGEKEIGGKVLRLLQRTEIRECARAHAQPCRHRSLRADLRLALVFEQGGPMKQRVSCELFCKRGGLAGYDDPRVRHRRYRIEWHIKY